MEIMNLKRRCLVLANKYIVKVLQKKLGNKLKNNNEIIK